MGAGDEFAETGERRLEIGGPDFDGMRLGDHVRIVGWDFRVGGWRC